MLNIPIFMWLSCPLWLRVAHRDHESPVITHQKGKAGVTIGEGFQISSKTWNKICNRFPIKKLHHLTKTKKKPHRPTSKKRWFFSVHFSDGGKEITGLKGTGTMVLMDIRKIKYWLYNPTKTQQELWLFIDFSNSSACIVTSVEFKSSKHGGQKLCICIKQAGVESRRVWAKYAWHCF